MGAITDIRGESGARCDGGIVMDSMHSEYWSKVIKTLSNRKEYLRQRVRFLDALPKKQYGHVFPNTFSYNETFREIDNLNDVLSEIHLLQEWYIDDVCPVCGEVIGFDYHEHHHISYYPEITIPVHKKCHITIHNTDSYPHLKRYFYGDGTYFYDGVKKPDYWIESGMHGHELKRVYSARASCYPRPNLNWNRAATTERDITYNITHRKVTKPRT